MPSADHLWIFCAGFGAGAINAVAGGGTLLTFPVLVWLGRDPVVANATNALALWPGSLAGAYALRREARQMAGLLRTLIPVSMLGAWLGGMLLLATPSRVFADIVPWLVLLATLLLAAQRPLVQLLGVRERGQDAPKATLGLLLGQGLVAIYGGYFGAGMGILMLASLALFGLSDIHVRNSVKNQVSAVINGVAGCYFAYSGAIVWADALVLAASAMLGGYAAAALSRKLPRRAVELLVVAVGITATIALAWRRV